MGFIEWIQRQTVAYVVYGLALAAMFALILATVLKLFVIGTKSDKLEYLKNYKKGQFAIIYVIAIPLYFFGYLRSAEIASGKDVLRQFLNSVDAAFGLVKLDFGMNDIVGAMSDKFYYATVLICYIITALNVLLFSASLLWQRIKNLCKKIRACFSDNLYIVVGCNDNDILLLGSLKKSGDKKARGILLAKPDAAMRDKLYLSGMCYSTFDCVNGSGAELCKKIKSLLGFRYACGRGMKKNVTVVINTEDDERNLLYVKALSELLQTEIRDTNYKKLLDVPVNAAKGLVMAYSFCRVENQAAFNELIEGSRGHIVLLNRYEQIAFDFVEKYPLTRYMTEEQVDYNKGLIKSYVDLNVCLVGFGPTARQLFLKMVSDSQYFTEIDGKIVHKKVHYYVYDKSEAYKDKNLNQTYFRYSLEFYREYKEYKKNTESAGVREGSDGWDYLPLPDYPADDWYNPECNGELSKDDAHFKAHFCEFDINSYDFYDGLKSVVGKNNSYTYIIVAFGEDLENIDLAKKITARLEMWGKSRDTRVFVKVRSDALADQQTQDSGIIKFGSTGSVYDLNKIADGKIRKLAYLKSFTYTRSDEGDEASRRSKAVKKWMGSSREQRAGNFYCCLNLKTKLNLLGFDYVEKTDSGKMDALKEFHEKYYGTTGSDEIKNLRFMFASVDKDKNDYKYDTGVFRDGSVRTLLAMQEHQRWNANYICNGVIPSKKSDIDGKGGGKDMKERLIHYNLTTFEGLDEYRVKAAGQAAAEDKYKEEVRQYDYRIMDFADLILSDAGYKIVRKH